MPETKYSFTESLFVLPLSGAIYALVLLCFFPFMLLTAWIRVYLWDWFAVPYLHLPHIGFVPMIGLGVLLSNVKYRSESKKKKEEGAKSEAWSNIWTEVFVELTGLLIGYCIHLYLIR